LSSAHEGRNVRVVEGLEPVLQIHRGQAELCVQFDVVFESVHRVLVEHFAVRVFEHAFFKPAAPASKNWSIRTANASHSTPARSFAWNRLLSRSSGVIDSVHFQIHGLQGVPFKTVKVIRVRLVPQLLQAYAV